MIFTSQSIKKQFDKSVDFCKNNIKMYHCGEMVNGKFISAEQPKNFRFLRDTGYTGTGLYMVSKPELTLCKNDKQIFEITNPFCTGIPYRIKDVMDINSILYLGRMLQISQDDSTKKNKFREILSELSHTPVFGSDSIVKIKERLPSLTLIQLENLRSNIAEEFAVRETTKEEEELFFEVIDYFRNKKEGNEEFDEFEKYYQINTDLANPEAFDYALTKLSSDVIPMNHYFEKLGYNGIYAEPLSRADNTRIGSVRHCSDCDPNKLNIKVNSM